MAASLRSTLVVTMAAPPWAFARPAGHPIAAKAWYARRTFSTMRSGSTVQTNGRGLSLCSATKRLIRRAQAAAGEAGLPSGQATLAARPRLLRRRGQQAGLGSTLPDRGQGGWRGHREIADVALDREAR